MTISFDTPSKKMRSLVLLIVVLIQISLSKNYRYLPYNSTESNESGNASNSSNPLSSTNESSSSSAFSKDDYDDSQKHHIKENERIVQLFGNYTIGYYYAEIMVGIQGHRETLILDTGSSITTFPCKECGDNCGNHINPPYNHQNEPLFGNIGCVESFFGWSCPNCYGIECRLKIAYVEGSSYKGTYKTDYVYFPSERQSFVEMEEKDKFKYKGIFGCTEKETGMFTSQQADGILGLGVNTNSSSNPPDIIQYSTVENRIHNNAFSVCFGKDGGFLKVGGFNVERHLPGATVQKTKYFDSGQYKVQLDTITAGDSTIGLSTSDLNAYQGVFLDTGATVVVGSRNIIDGIFGTIKQYCKEKPGKRCGGYTHVSYNAKCFRVKKSGEFTKMKDLIASFPPITFILEGDAHLSWFPEDYFVESDSSSDEMCIALDYVSGRLILGAIIMRSYDVYFDRKNMEIRFARANCEADYVPLNDYSSNNSESNSESKIREFNHKQNADVNHIVTKDDVKNHRKKIQFDPFKSRLSLKVKFVLNIMFCFICVGLMYCFIYKDRYRREYYVTETEENDYSDKHVFSSKFEGYDGDLSGGNQLEMERIDYQINISAGDQEMSV